METGAPMNFKYTGMACSLFIAAVPVCSHAQAVVNYTYDALGRVVRVDNTGGVNNQISASYSFDAASNRTNKQVTNSPNGSGGSGSEGGSVGRSRIIVVPSGTGFALIIVP